MRKSVNKWLKSNPVTSLLLAPVIEYRRKQGKKLIHLKKDFLKHISKTLVAGMASIEIKDYMGIFEMDIRSDILHRMLLFNDYESQVANLIKEHLDPSRDVLDVGANVGLHSVFFSKLINNDSRVLSFEPTPNALKFLKSNLEKNQCDRRVTIFAGVATDKPGNYEMEIIEGKEEYSALGKINHPDALDYKVTKITVEGDTIDNLVAKYNLNPGFMKVDTEGAEVFVFRGARQTIEKYRPVIISELSESLIARQQLKTDDIYQFLKDNEYMLLDVLTGKEITGNFEGYFIALP